MLYASVNRPYTIEPKEPSPWNLLLREANLNTVYGTDTIELPFDDASFGSVLACGVLEHVEDELGSLKELVRVLSNNGLLVLLMFPNRWSWAEFLARRLPRRGHHDRLYTQKSMKDILGQGGFRAMKTYRSNVIPKNLEGVPERIRQFVGSYADFLLDLDALLSLIPPFSWFSGVLEGLFVLRK